MRYFNFILIAGFTVWMFWMFTFRGTQALIRQHAAESYPSVAGWMRASEVETYTGSKGSIHYRAAFLYGIAMPGTHPMRLPPMRWWRLTPKTRR